MPSKYLLTDWIIAASYSRCVQPLFDYKFCSAEFIVKHFSKGRVAVVDLIYVGGTSVQNQFCVLGICQHSYRKVGIVILFFFKPVDYFQLQRVLILPKLGKWSNNQPQTD